MKTSSARILDSQAPPRVKSTGAGRASPTEVPAARLDRWLCLYPPAERHLSGVAYCDDGFASAIVLPHGIDYSEIDVSYYTCTQVSLLASQMTYVLAGESILAPGFKPLPTSIYDLFLARLARGQIYYTDFRVRFRRKVDNRHENPIWVGVSRTHRLAGLWFMVASLDMGCGACIGSLQLVMPEVIPGEEDDRQ